MYKVTLRVEHDNITIARNYEFDSVDELLSSEWADHIESMVDTIEGVPYNETEIPQFSGTLQHLKNITI